MSEDREKPSDEERAEEEAEEAPLPWERQPGETPKAFDAFQGYLQMEPRVRSVTTLARHRQRGLAVLKEWAAKYHWVRRAEEWDDFQAAEERERITQARREAATRWTNEAKAFQGAAIAKLVDVRQKDPTLQGMSLGDALRFFYWSVRVEAMALGNMDPAEAAQVKRGPPDQKAFDLSKLDDAELEAVTRAVEKARVEVENPIARARAEAKDAEDAAEAIAGLDPARGGKVH